MHYIFLLACLPFRFSSVHFNHTLQPLYSGVAPKFVRKPDSGQCKVGETLTLGAVISGNPKPDVYWMHKVRLGTTCCMPHAWVSDYFPGGNSDEISFCQPKLEEKYFFTKK